MEYRNWVKAVNDLSFIENEETAGAAVKAAFGIIASMMDDEEVKRFTEALPEPLTLEKLRGHQISALKVKPAEYIEQMATQFNLDSSQARELVQTIIHTTKVNLSGDKVREWKAYLPQEWGSFIEKEGQAAQATGNPDEERKKEGWKGEPGYDDPDFPSAP